MAGKRDGQGNERLFQTGHRGRLRWACLLLLGLLCGGCSSLYTAERIQLMRTEGQVDIVSSRGKEVAPVPEMKLYSGYAMATEKESFAWINLDSVKLAKMDEESQISISKRRKGLEVEVACGSLYFNIKEPLEKDETLDIRTSNMAVGIRGTCGWVEVADPLHMSVYILEGTVACTVRDPKTKEETEAAVSAGEMAELILDPEAEEGSVCQIQTSSFVEGDIAAFVLPELLEDEGLCEAIKAASGLDVLGMDPSAGEGGPEDSSSLDFDLYGAFIKNELEPKYGTGDNTSFAYGFVPQTIDGWDNGMAYPATASLVDGIVGTCRRDLDMDGSDELLMFYVEGSAGGGAGQNNLGLKVYSQKDGAVEEVGGMRFENCFGGANEEMYRIGLKELGDRRLLYAEGSSSVYTFADGVSPEIYLYQYDGSTLEEVYGVSTAGSDGSWWNEWRDQLRGFGFVLPAYGEQWGDIGLDGEPGFERLFYGSCRTNDAERPDDMELQQYLLEQGRIDGELVGPESDSQEQTGASFTL